MIVGKWIIVAGLIVVAIGLAVQYAPWTVSWFGNLPGDIHLSTGWGRVFVPFSSMIIVGIVLALLANSLRR